MTNLKLKKEYPKKAVGSQIFSFIAEIDSYTIPYHTNLTAECLEVQVFAIYKHPIIPESDEYYRIANGISVKMLDGQITVTISNSLKELVERAYLLPLCMQVSENGSVCEVVQWPDRHSLEICKEKMSFRHFAEGITDEVLPVPFQNEYENTNKVALIIPGNVKDKVEFFLQQKGIDVSDYEYHSLVELPDPDTEEIKGYELRYKNKRKGNKYLRVWYEYPGQISFYGNSNEAEEVPLSFFP